MAGFKQTLKEAVRQMSFRTSLDSLKKKGVQQVSVLGIDRIIALIEAAVHKSLHTHLAGIERDAVADATKAEFLRLLRSNEDLQRQKTEIEQQRERAQEEVDQLRRELSRQQSALRLELEQESLEQATRYEGENAVIAQKVADVVRALAAAPDTPLATFEHKIVELVMDVVSAERQEAETARRALRDREVDNLQRRIKKLSDSLTTTEHRLQQVSALKGLETGISSIYRDVQGLDASDAQASKKKELMTEIFKANLLLRQRGKGA